MTGSNPPRRRGFLRRWLASEEGNVTFDFAVILPIYLMIMLASFEAGYTMVRMVVMDRSLDIAIRDLRVGALGENPSHVEVRERFCEQNILMPTCLTQLMLEMRVVNRTTWQGFNAPATCIDRTTNIEPVLTFQQGGSNEIVTIRACAVFDPFFPTTRLGLRMPRDNSGGYQMATMSVFVNEPRGN